MCLTERIPIPGGVGILFHSIFAQGYDNNFEKLPYLKLIPRFSRTLGTDACDVTLWCFIKEYQVASEYM